MAATGNSGVEFPFFGGNRTLKFAINEFIELEGATGKTPMELAGSIMRMSIVDLRTTLWVGLKTGDRRLVTREWVGNKLQEYINNGGTMLPILKCIDEAFVDSRYFKTDEEAAQDGSANPPRAAEVHHLGSPTPARESGA